MGKVCYNNISIIGKNNLYWIITHIVRIKYVYAAHYYEGVCDQKFYIWHSKISIIL